MNSIPTLQSVRRIAVMTAVCLIIYSIARNPHALTMKLSIIGLNINVPRSLFDITLPLLCIYSGLRYIYYLVQHDKPPWIIRKALLAGVIPSFFWSGSSLNGYQLYVKIRLYFPMIPRDCLILEQGSESRPADDANAFAFENQPVLNIIEEKVPFYIRWMWRFSDLEYATPGLLSLFAVIYFILSIFL